MEPSRHFRTISNRSRIPEFPEEPTLLATPSGAPFPTLLLSLPIRLADSSIIQVMAGIESVKSALAARYDVEREIGAGGMATVYLARDLKHGRDVAIKVLRPEVSDQVGSDRFLREIRLTAGLDHPNILALLDSGETESLSYYVLPFVRGESLRAKLDREGRLDVDEAVRIAREVAGALHYAHGRGIIHRDVKPENILLGDGRARLADFGIAFVHDSPETRLTLTGASIGTPYYMSPEQAGGERTVDARSDVFSLGAVVYEMVTGEPPFSGSSQQAVIARILLENPVPPRMLRPSLSEKVSAAILMALAREPSERFATADAFGRALEAAVSGPLPPVATGVARGPRMRSVTRVTAVLVGVAMSSPSPLAKSRTVRRRAGLPTRCVPLSGARAVRIHRWGRRPSSCHCTIDVRRNCSRSSRYP